MAKVKSTGYTDTPISGVTVLTHPRAILNVGVDFRVKSSTAGKEIVLTNITSPVDRPEKIRIAYTDVANIYSGTGIEASLLAPTKRGVSILAQVTETISVTDSVDPNYRIDLPVSYHLVIKVPASEYINAADVQTGISRLLSSLFDSGVETTSRLEAILRGSLVPSDL
jgi:hypothetical protein